MHKKIFISLLIIFISLNISNVSQSMNNINISKINEDKISEVLINNINNKDLNISVENIDIFEESIDIGEKYSCYGFLTINIENKGIYDIELSNIDIYPYQGENPTKYFVKTSDDNIDGLIGTIRSNSNIKAKVGIALYNKTETIRLDLRSIEYINK